MTTIKRKKNSKYSPNHQCVLALLGLCLLLSIGATVNIFSKKMDANNVPKATATIRKHRKNSPALKSPSFSKHNPTNENAIDLMRKGHLHLIDISIGHTNPFGSQDNNPPYSVIGTFCHLEWSKHKADPAAVPMFKDLQKKSPACSVTKSQIDLFTAVTEARKYDKVNESVNIRSMAPRGFVFHESRCGSTLVANSLAFFDAEKNRVYSESGPPIAAAKAFDPDFEEASIQLLRDVLYVMGRTEENLFFKVQSIGSKSIGAFRKAFPITPWIYVYRDPVQVMKSHLKVKGTENAVCLRSQRHPTKDIAKLAQQIGSASPEQLSTEKFCAAHLATLCQAAEKEIVDARGIGRLVNYAELPNILIEDIIPFHFLKQKSLLSTETTERIIKVNEKYSKGRDTNKDWAEDSEQKEATAWDELKDASKEYLYPVYERMEALRLQK